MDKASLIVALLLSSCRHESSTVSPPPAASHERTGSTVSSVPSSEARDLDGLDTRTSVPLLPTMANHQKENMRDHLRAVEEIAAGAASGDFPAVERAAARIGYSEQMGRMCTHMGAGARGFTERALEFHHAADTILAAARERDQTKVLQALAATLAHCTGCHAVFKQRIVDETTWRRLTAGQDE